MESGHLRNLLSAGKRPFDRGHGRPTFAEAAGTEQIRKPKRIEEPAERIRPQIDLTDPVAAPLAPHRGVSRHAPDIPPAIFVDGRRRTARRMDQR
jgi:hypothetical protein